MSVTPVSELKAHLSAYLKQVKAGNPVVITERGRPIARLVPITAEGERRESLVAAGLLIPGRGRIRKSLLTLPAGDPIDGVVEALIAEREEGR